MNEVVPRRCHRHRQRVIQSVCVATTTILTIWPQLLYYSITCVLSRVSFNLFHCLIFSLLPSSAMSWRRGSHAGYEADKVNVDGLS